MNCSAKLIFFKAILFASSCTPLCAVIITIKSCNVLHEELYQKWANGVSKMPTQLRRDLLTQAFNDKNQLAEADILCLQEWDTSLNKIFKDYDNLVYRYIAYDLKRPGGLLIAWNKKKFKFQGPPKFYKFGEANRAFGITFVLKDNRQKSIYIVSLHASFIYGYERRYESVLEQLNTIKNDIKNIPVDAAFICGDFNYNVHSQQAKTCPNRKLNEEDAEILYQKLTDDGWQNANQWLLKRCWPTLFGYTGFEIVDYILSKGNVKHLAYWQYPENQQGLIKHHPPLDNEGPHYLKYFSDHAIIGAKFRIL